MNPTDAPKPIHCGCRECNQKVSATLTSTGMNEAPSASAGRSSANSERPVNSNRLQPTKLGARPRKTVETSAVDSAVKLPR